MHLLELKETANVNFRAGRLVEAEAGYTAALHAIDSMPDPDPAMHHDLHCNRAAARLRLQQHSGALADAQAALAIQPMSVKAMYRSAQALQQLGGASRLQEALRIAQQAAQREPGNKEVRALADQLAQACRSQSTTSPSTPASASAAAQGAQAPLPAGSVLHAMPPVSSAAKQQLPAHHIPAELRASHRYVPSQDGINENLLILFHGLGDTPGPFAVLATKLALPQTACLVLPGPLEVPETDGGRAWFTAFDDDWELIQPRKGDVRRTRSLDRTCVLLSRLVDNLADAGLWLHQQMSLFGFSQGGTTALQLHRQCKGHRRLAGCISIAGALLEEHIWEEQSDAERPSSATGCGPVLITRGDKDMSTTAAAVDMTIKHLQAHDGCASAQVCEVPGKGHGMLGPVEAEVVACMKFWANTLRAAAPAPGVVEVRTVPG